MYEGIGKIRISHLSLNTKLGKSKCLVIWRRKAISIKGLKPVYWSPSSESALAEAEIEYHDKKSASIYVAFHVKDGKGVCLKRMRNLSSGQQHLGQFRQTLGFPSTRRFKYVVVNAEGTRYIVAKHLLKQLLKKIGWETSEVEKTVKGSELEYVVAKHPFYDRDSLVMLGEHVTTDAGTGCVHTAPGHGEDDFIVGQKYNLGVLCSSR